MHKLRPSPLDTTIMLADGTTVKSTEVVTLKLRVQQHTSTCRFVVTDMVPGFDVVLGDDWSRRHAVVASFAGSATCALPHLWLPKTRCRLVPAGPDAVPSDPSEQVISAGSAARLLAAPRFGSAAPFVVLVRKLDADEPDPAVSATVVRSALTLAHAGM